MTAKWTPNHLIHLRDFPNTLTGTELQSWRTNAAGTALEPYTPSGGGGAFTGLSDVPASYAGFNGCMPIVNSGETGLVFGARTFPVKAYGAVGDGRFVQDGQISAGTSSLSCNTSAPFSINDIGKSIIIMGAGIAGVAHDATITSYSSPSVVGLSSPVATTVSSTRVAWGTDDGDAFQSAINAAEAVMGGNVVVENKMYFFGLTKSLTFLSNEGQVSNYWGTCPVVFTGDTIGPFNTWETLINNVSPPCPILLITNINDNFIKLYDSNATIQNMSFLYPIQVPKSSEGPPLTYPATIVFKRVLHSIKIQRCTFWNAFDGIDARAGALMCFFVNLFMGAYNKGLRLDNCREVNYIQNYHNQVYWNFMERDWSGFSPITSWVYFNPDNYCLEVLGAEQQMVSNMFCYNRQGGILLDRSLVGQGGNEKSYGLAVQCHFDFVNVGIMIEYTKSNYIPWRFYGVEVIGTKLIHLKRDMAIVNGGYAGLTRNNNACTAETGAKLYTSNIHNFNQRGVLTAPSIPASNAAYTNTFVFHCNVHISGGTVTDIKINATSTGLTSGTFTLAPYETITLTYSAAPSWVWFGL